MLSYKNNQDKNDLSENKNTIAELSRQKAKVER
jgi:hypothetical protein